MFAVFISKNCCNTWIVTSSRKKDKEIDQDKLDKDTDKYIDIDTDKDIDIDKDIAQDKLCLNKLVHRSSSYLHCLQENNPNYSLHHQQTKIDVCSRNAFLDFRSI